MSKIIRALIVDDEQEACENLHRFIEQIDPTIEIIGYAHSTQEVETFLNKENPSLLFLDIEMPNENGIDFLKRLEKINFEVVFVTAYDNYAIKAFKLNAIDYVLKPLKKEYLEKTLERVKEFILASGTTNNETITNLNDQSNNQLTMRIGSEVHFIQFQEIRYFASEGNYTKVYTKKSNQVYTSSYNLKHYEDIVPDSFMRVHRAFIINQEHIEQLKSENGKHHLVFSNNVEIPISRRRYKSFKEKIN